MGPRSCTDRAASAHGLTTGPEERRRCARRRASRGHASRASPHTGNRSIWLGPTVASLRGLKRSGASAPSSACFDTGLALQTGDRGQTPSALEGAEEGRSKGAGPALLGRARPVRPGFTRMAPRSSATSRWVLRGMRPTLKEGREPDKGNDVDPWDRGSWGCDELTWAHRRQPWAWSPCVPAPEVHMYTCTYARGGCAVAHMLCPSAWHSMFGHA